MTIKEEGFVATGSITPEHPVDNPHGGDVTHAIMVYGRAGHVSSCSWDHLAPEYWPIMSINMRYSFTISYYHVSYSSCFSIKILILKCLGVHSKGNLVKLRKKKL